MNALLRNLFSAVVILLFLAISPSRAALIFNPGDTIKTENFDGLGTETAFPVAGVPFTAWDTDSTDASITTMLSNDGTGTGGGIRNVGGGSVNPDTDRALGSLGTGTLEPAFGVNVQNNTGQTIGGFAISYRGEHWRSGNDVVTELWNFQYAVVSSEITMGDSAASWINFDALDMVELNPTLTTGAARDGNAAGNFTELNATLSVPLSDGEFLAIRWVDLDNPGFDAIMAIDDFQILAVPEPEHYALCCALALLAISGVRIWCDSRRPSLKRPECS